MGLVRRRLTLQGTSYVSLSPERKILRLGPWFVTLPGRVAFVPCKAEVARDVVESNRRQGKPGPRPHAPLQPYSQGARYQRESAYRSRREIHPEVRKAPPVPSFESGIAGEESCLKLSSCEYVCVSDSVYILSHYNPTYLASVIFQTTQKYRRTELEAHL